MRSLTTIYEHEGAHFIAIPTKGEGVSCEGCVFDKDCLCSLMREGVVKECPVGECKILRPLSELDKLGR